MYVYLQYTYHQETYISVYIYIIYTYHQHRYHQETYINIHYMCIYRRHMYVSTYVRYTDIYDTYDICMYRS